MSTANPFTWLSQGGNDDGSSISYKVPFICQAMNWKYTYDVLSVAPETFDESIGLVPMKGLIARDILHKNFVAENKAFWDQIPIQADTCKGYVTGSKSTWP